MSLNRNWDGLTEINCPKDTDIGSEYKTSTGIVSLLLTKLQHKIYESTGEIIGVIELIV
jgi:hypothetical protein